MYRLFLFLTICGVAFSLEESAVKFSFDYFENKDLRRWCLLTCNDDELVLNFAKQASRKHFMVSSVDIDRTEDSHSLMSCLRQQFSIVAVVVDAGCANFQEVMNLVSKEMIFDVSHNWLVIHKLYNSKVNLTLAENHTDTIFPIEDAEFDDMSNSSPILEVFEGLNISVDADIVVAYEKGSETFHLYDFFNFGRIQGGKLISSFIGTWTEEDGLQLATLGYKYQQRWDFQDLPLRMIVVSTRPKSFLPEMLKTENEDINIITRVSTTILDIIAEKHNFRFIYSVTDRWIGTFNRNSSRVVANSLHFREQDVTPLLRITPDLAKRLDFIQTPVSSIETKFYYRIPTTGVGKYENQFLTPLTNDSWICIVAISIICALVLLVAAMSERHTSSGQYAMFTVLALVCQQFFDDNEENRASREPRTSTARKIAVLVTGVSCLLLYNYYTSSVVGWLLSGAPPSINSLQELLESPLELVFEDTGYTKSWLQVPGYYYNRRNAKVEDALRTKKVFNKKKGDPLLMSLDEGISMVKGGGYAFHAQVANANTRISQTFDKMQLCELGSLQSMEKTEVFTAVQKRSPYKEFLSWNLAILHERGFVSCIQRRLASPDIRCDGSVPRALALGGAAPAFVLLAGGYMVAVAVLVIEVLVTWYAKKRNSLHVPISMN